jgi:glycosyltransferase involved in cell wall biosynthesis
VDRIEHTLRMESGTSTRARIVAATQRLREVDAPAELRIGTPIGFAPLPRRAFVEMKALVALTRAAGIARSLRASAEARIGRAVEVVGIEVPVGKPAMHQAIQSIRPFDAVSNDALAIQALLREHGYFSEIFAENIHPSLRGVIRSIDRLLDPNVRNAPVLNHVCVQAPRLTRILQKRPGALHLRLHSNTPPRWFMGVSAGCEVSARQGWSEMAEMSRYAISAIADSAHNAQEVQSVGTKNVTVVPIVLEPVDVGAMRATGGGGYAVIVARTAPNKRLDFSIRTIAAYQRAYDPNFGLVIIGSEGGLERYADACRALVDELGVSNVRWTGLVDEAEKLDLLRNADAYLCTSDHEGFCVPIVESFRIGLPVVARATSAVTGTCGEALAIETDDPSYLADVLRVVVTDAELREELIGVQDQEAKRFDPAVVGKQFLAWVDAQTAR